VVPDAEGLATGQEEHNCNEQRDNAYNRSRYARTNHPVVTTPLSIMTRVIQPVKRTVAKKVYRHD